VVALAEIRAAPAVLRQSSFEEYYRVQRDSIYRALLLTIGNQSLAAEAVDEAMVRTYQRWRTVSKYRNPAGWSYRVALNWARDQLRKRKREQLGDAPEMGVPVPSVGDPMLLEALGSLPLEYRSVVVLRYYFDWSQVQIADALDIPEGTVKSRLNRGLAELRKRKEVTGEL
jgi:RNA polymerase sigma-70 factor (ECF subfamily)